MTDATCKTCPNWCEGECRATVPEHALDTGMGESGRIVVRPYHKHPHTQEFHWCGKHPVRVAAYEAAVLKAKATAFAGEIEEIRKIAESVRPVDPLLDGMPEGTRLL